MAMPLTQADQFSYPPKPEPYRPATAPPTKAQLRVLMALKYYIRKHNRAPLLRELAPDAGYKTVGGGLHKAIEGLISKGYLFKTVGQRKLRLTEAGERY